VIPADRKRKLQKLALELFTSDNWKHGYKYVDDGEYACHLSITYNGKIPRKSWQFDKL